jgi:undecaprenyl phosphate-alpha-L-ara4N flippase subunit ArnE
MTAVAVAIALTAQLLFVVGQLLLKRGMGQGAVRPRTLALAITLLAGWFFLWVGLMSQWELSKLFPFEGLNPALVALAAWYFLNERMSTGAWLGVGLICVGIILVAGS